MCHYVSSSIKQVEILALYVNLSIITRPSYSINGVTKDLI